MAELKHGHQFRTPDFTDEGVKVLKITQIKSNGLIDISSCDFISEERINEFRKFILKKGDILMALTGATIGKTARYNKDEVALQNYRVGNFFSRDESILSKDYLYSFLTSKYFFNQILARQTQSAQQNIGKDEINKMLIFLPDISEQKAIAHVLGTLDDRIELNRQMNETLEAMAQALFKSWFVDFDPVMDNVLANGKEIPEELSEKTHARGALRDKRWPLPEEIRALFPGEFSYSEKLGWIPKGWVVEPLGNITTELRRGISPKYIEDGGVRVVNQRCIRNHEIDYSLAKRNDDKQRKVEGRFLEEGDLLINSTGVGTLGRMAQVHALDEPTVVDSHVTIARADRGKYKPYTFGHMMFSIEPYVEAMGEGSTGQTELSRKNLAEIPTIVPPRCIQEIAEGHFCNLGKKAAFNSQCSYTLRLTRDTLLPKLLSGELRIPDAEKLVERIGG